MLSIVGFVIESIGVGCVLFVVLEKRVMQKYWDAVCNNVNNFGVNTAPAESTCKKVRSSRVIDNYFFWIGTSLILIGRVMILMEMVCTLLV